MGTYRLQLLGGFSLGSQEDSVSLSSKKAKALLAFLALHSNQSFSRDQLASLLWEDSDATQARQSLRQSLAVIRKALGGAKEGLVAEGDTISLSSEAVSVDVVEFEKLGKENIPESLECAMNLFKGDLLEGFNPRAAQFDDWLMLEQSRVRELALQIMQRLIEHYQTRGKFESAIQLAIRFLHLDPLQESMHRTLMQLYLQVNKLGAALKQYRACKATLSRELKINPEAATVALYRDILARRDQSENSNELVPLTQQEVSKENEDKPQRFSETDHFLRHLVFIAIHIAPKQMKSTASETEQYAMNARNLIQKIETITGQQGGLFFQTLSGQAICIFGLPIRYSDDLVRALVTAKKMLEACLHVGDLNVSLGMACGKVYVEQENEHYRFFGGAISLAEQLSCVAKTNELLVCDEVVQNLRHQGLGLKPVDSDAGFEVSCWQVTDFNFHNHSLAIVGRQKERALFSGVIEECLLIEKAQAILVRGEAGIGKSRLTEEFIDQACANDFVPVIVQCRHFGEEASNNILAQITKAMFLGEKQPLLSRDKINDMDCLSPQQRSFLNFLLGDTLNSWEQAQFSELDSTAFHLGLQQTVFSLLDYQARQQPVLLVVEDVHWAKSHSLLEMAELTNIISDLPMIVIMTSRWEGDALDLNWRSKIMNTPLSTLDLNPLHQRESCQFAKQLNIKNQSFLDHCIKRSHGNPLFLQQLLLASEQSVEDLPDTIQNIILSRVDQLSKQEQKILQAASVLGDKIEIDALRFMIDNNSPPLKKLVQERMLVERQQYLTFFHALFRESIYLSLLDSLKRKLHEKAAQWYQDREKVVYAYHLGQVDHPEALRVYFQVASQLHEQNRSDEALVQIKQALQLTPKDRHSQLQLLCLHGEVSRHLGNTQESEVQLRQAIDLCCDQNEEKALLCKLYTELADTLRMSNSIDNALDYLKNAERLNQPIDAFLQARIHYLRGSILFPQGKLDECMKEHSLSLQYATSTGSGLLCARAQSGLGDAFYQRGQMLTARQHFQEAVSIAEASGYQSIQSINLSMNALISYFNDEVENAKAQSQKALSLAKQCNFRRGELLALDVMINMASYWDEFDDIESIFAVAEALAEQLGSKGIGLEIQSFKGLFLLKQGNQQMADELLLNTYERCEPSLLPFVGPTILGLWARVTGDRNRREWALSQGKDILETRNCVSHNYIIFYQCAIQVCIDHSLIQLAQQFADELSHYTKLEPLMACSRFVEMARQLKS